MKKLALAALIAFTLTVQAAEYSTQINTASCTAVATSGGATGAVVGTAVGAGVGSMVGRALFGRRNGGTIGAIAGAVGGGLAGEKMTSSTTYRCILGFNKPDGKPAFAETTGNMRSPGQTIRVFDNGTNILVN